MAPPPKTPAARSAADRKGVPEARKGKRGLGGPSARGYSLWARECRAMRPTFIFTECSEFLPLGEVEDRVGRDLYNWYSVVVTPEHFGMPVARRRL